MADKIKSVKLENSVVQILSHCEGLEQVLLRSSGVVETISAPEKFQSELLLSPNLRNVPNLVKLFKNLSSKIADAGAQMYVLYDLESKDGEDKLLIISLGNDKLRIQPVQMEQDTHETDSQIERA